MREIHGLNILADAKKSKVIIVFHPVLLVNLCLTHDTFNLRLYTVWK